MNNEQERKDRMDTIRMVLRATEELKAAISPLIRDQKDVFKILKSFEEAIAFLMDDLIGTREDHEKHLEALELVRSSVSRIEEEQEIHEAIHAALEKRLRDVEFRPISQIVKKIKEKKVTATDLDVIDSILAAHPDDENLLKVKIVVLERMDREQEALEIVEEAISKHSKDEWLWHRKGALVDDFDKSLECFDVALKLLKDGSPIRRHSVLFSRAAIYGNAGRLEEALDSSTKAVEANPKCPGGWHQKGKILVELSRIPEALGCLEKAIDLEKDFEEAWLEKGNALSALGPDHFDDAIACYDMAIKLNPEYAIAYFNKSRLLGDREQYEKALQTIEKGLEFDNKDTCAWCHKGVFLNSMKRNEEALTSFRKALEPGRPKECYQIFENIMIVLHVLGREKEIIELFDQYSKDPSFFEEMPQKLLNAYAYELWEHTKRHGEGVEIARKAAKMDPQKGEVWDTLACNLEASGNDEEALDAFEKALSLKESDNEITWAVLAKLYKRMGRIEEAEQADQKSHAVDKTREQDETNT